MIGPAEIEDMLSDYADALAEAGMAPDRLAAVGRIGFWPVTQPDETVAQRPVPYDVALERLRRAASDHA